MKLQIIETPDYILAVSDEEIKKSDYVYQVNFEKTNPQVLKAITDFQIKIANDNSGSYVKLKITAHQPKGNAPELDLPLLPEIIVEDDVEKLAENIWILLTDGKDVCVHKGDWSEGFKQGHRAATKVYSEDDLRKAIEIIRMDTYKRESVDQIIQSLKQPKSPEWFVAETITIWNRNTDRSFPTKADLDEELKTTTIDGKTYLVGTYLYE